MGTMTKRWGLALSRWEREGPLFEIMLSELRPFMASLLASGRPLHSCVDVSCKLQIVSPGPGISSCMFNCKLHMVYKWQHWSVADML